MNKYNFQIANMTHTAIMLYGHIDPTFLNVCTKTKPTTIFTSHIIALYG